MTDHDFVCWLRGFTAGVGDSPSVRDWALVREQLAVVGQQVGHPGHARMPNLFNPAHNPGQVFGPIVAQ